MKVIAINGSPRKNWNTDTLLTKVLDGASSAGAETEMVYLYDLNFKGCISCMACKLKGGKSLGRCAMKDDLTPVLDAVHEADAVILGSPLYWHVVTGEMRSFMERFVFQYHNYDDYNKLMSPPKKTVLLYTMNMPEALHEEYHYKDRFRQDEELLRHFFKHCTTLYSTETLQVEDYGRYHMGRFDEKALKLRHEQVFPQDCQKAFELGVSLVRG
jgi:multimeric flavodoxin WrbA